MLPVSMLHVVCGTANNSVWNTVYCDLLFPSTSIVQKWKLLKGSGYVTLCYYLTGGWFVIWNGFSYFHYYWIVFTVACQSVPLCTVYACSVFGTQYTHIPTLCWSVLALCGNNTVAQCQWLCCVPMLAPLLMQVIPHLPFVPLVC